MYNKTQELKALGSLKVKANLEIVKDGPYLDRNATAKPLYFESRSQMREYAKRNDMTFW